MTLVTFIGYTLIAYSPLTALFSLWIARTARYSIVFVVSTFFWLWSMLCSGLVWYLTGQNLRENLYYSIMVGVTLQELTRGLLYWSYTYVKVPLMKLSPNHKNPLISIQYGTSSGLGFATMSTLVYSINILKESYGPGTYYSSSCPRLPFFLITGRYM